MVFSFIVANVYRISFYLYTCEVESPALHTLCVCNPKFLANNIFQRFSPLLNNAMDRKKKNKEKEKAL